MVKSLGKICCLLFVLFGLFQASFVHAKYTVGDAQGFVDKVNQVVGAEKTDVESFAAKIVKGGLSVVGLVFFILIFYGGYLWLTAQGKDEQIKKAQDTIIASIIGLAIIVGSYAITNFVMKRLVGKSTSADVSPEKATEGGAAPVVKGCCLDKTKIPGSIWDIGSKEHVYWSLTDEKTCDTQGKTCGDDDQLCGSEHYKFFKDIKDEKGCEEAKNKWEETL